MGRNQILGAKGEELVCQYLTARSYRILERNWRSKCGELDLIALSKIGKVCFIEVKTRSSLRFGHPLEAIDAKKALRLQKLALDWLALHNLRGIDYSIDCASVLFSEKSFDIEYRESVL
jgi:putative endonuclease